MLNVTEVYFSGATEARSPSLWQWDYGQIMVFPDLDLPNAYEVHFATGTGSVTAIGTVDGVQIPDECLTKSGSVNVYIYLHEGADDGETVYHAVLPVIGRSEPSHEEPTPVQQSEIEQVIAALNGAVEDAEGFAQAAQEAAESIPELAPVATSGDYSDLTNKPVIPTVPTDVSAFVNDAGYQTASDLNSALLASLITDTASGDPCAISDGASAPVVDCTVQIVPKQEGSGTPSPSNIRPISGWTEMTLTANGETITKSWTPTVYGGNLDLTTGLLTVTYGMVDLGTLTWETFNANGRTAFRARGQLDGVPVTGQTGKANAVCDSYEIVQNGDIANTSYDNVIAVGAYWTTGCNVYIYDSAKVAMTTDEFKTAMSGVMLAYELANPTETIQLTPTEVSTILGSNTFSADTGSVTVEYRCDTKLYIAKVV